MKSTSYPAERRAFHAELKAESDKRNAEALERKREQGLVWAPVSPAGGDEAGAVFSSSVVWDGLRNEIRDGAHHEPTLHLRDVCHLFWALNAIRAGGGSATIPSGAGTVPPSWPSYDREAVDGIRFQQGCLQHVAKLGYVEIAEGAGTLTITVGPRSAALSESRREHVAA